MEELDNFLKRLTSEVDAPIAEIIPVLRDLNIKNLIIVRDIADFLLIFNKHTKED